MFFPHLPLFILQILTPLKDMLIFLSRDFVPSHYALTLLFFPKPLTLFFQVKMFLKKMKYKVKCLGKNENVIKVIMTLCLFFQHPTFFMTLKIFYLTI